jgi:hypothetical protein
MQNILDTVNPILKAATSIFGVNTEEKNSIEKMNEQQPHQDERRTSGEQLQVRSSAEQHPEDEEMHALLQQERELRNRISELNRQIGRKERRLGSLQKQDDAEKWEDRLFEARTTELEGAREEIHTQPSVYEEDVRKQIDVLNRAIIQIAEIATVGSGQKSYGLGEKVSKNLAEDLGPLFRKDDRRLGNKLAFRAVLQIFLAQSCMRLINSWDLGNTKLNALLPHLYGRLRDKGKYQSLDLLLTTAYPCFPNAEEQTIAGKWRQITATQLQSEALDRIFRAFADQKAQQVIDMSAAAGWRGESTDVHHRVQKLMKLAADIRLNVKAGIISADLRPWIASYHDGYDSRNMVDVSRRIPALVWVENAEGSPVLGSTEVGLRVHIKGDKLSAELEGLQLSPKVLLVSSFGGELRRSYPNPTSGRQVDPSRSKPASQPHAKNGTFFRSGGLYTF